MSSDVKNSSVKNTPKPTIEDLELKRETIQDLTKNDAEKVQGGQKPETNMRKGCVA